MKERKIITIGRPSIENLTKNEQKVLYSTLLSCVIDYYKDKEKASDDADAEKENMKKL